MSSVDVSPDPFFEQGFEDILVGLDNASDNAICFVDKMARRLVAAAPGVDVKTIAAFQVFENFESTFSIFFLSHWPGLGLLS